MLKITLEFEDGQVYKTSDVGFATIIAEVKYQLPVDTSKEVILIVADFARNIYMDRDESMRPDLYGYAASQVYELILKYGTDNGLADLVEQFVITIAQRYEYSF